MGQELGELLPVLGESLLMLRGLRPVSRKLPKVLLYLLWKRVALYLVYQLYVHLVVTVSAEHLMSLGHLMMPLYELS